MILLLLLVLILTLLYFFLLRGTSPRKGRWGPKDLRDQVIITNSSSTEGTCSRKRPRRHKSLSTVGMKGRMKARNTSPSLDESKVRENEVEEFRCETKWPGLIGKPLDQKDCGSCWAFSASSCLSDRIRIATNGRLLKDDYISPYDVAACNQCEFSSTYHEGKILRATENLAEGPNERFYPLHKTPENCTGVCHGNYLDSTLEFLVQEGGISLSKDPEGKEGSPYFCTSRKTPRTVLYRGKEKYLLSSHQVSEENVSFEVLSRNEENIRTDLKTNGTVCALIRMPEELSNYTGEQVEGTTDEEGVYYKLPSSDEFNGYHAVNITGFGTTKKGRKYWWVRNSWGPNWGIEGSFKIPRGENYCGIEEDVWSIIPSPQEEEILL